jgi:hypothetical protein
MIQIVITDDNSIKLTQQALKDMPGKIKQVVRRANIDTIRAVRGEIPKAVNQRYAMSRSGVRAHMHLSTRSEDGGFRMGLIVTGKRIPMMDFDVKPQTPPPQAGVPVARRTPVSITTLRSRRQIGRPNRFITRMKSGHVGVFRRSSRVKRSVSLPIAELFDPSIAEMVRSKEIRQQIEQRARETLQRSIQRNIQAVLNPKPK